MYQNLLADIKFHELLLAYDHDIADAARNEGCRCGGALHSARYRRKAAGVPARLREIYGWRLSWCCAVDGCRRRRTPASVRFLGPRVYVAAMVVLISTMLYGATPPRVRRLSQLCGVDRRTVVRWRQWWLRAFTASPFWHAARSRFKSPIEEERLPASLLERFAGTGAAERLFALLRFLGPITGGTAARHAA